MKKQLSAEARAAIGQRLKAAREKRRMAISERDEVAESVAAATNDRTGELLDLLDWVARAIVTRNANGKKSDKFCALCQKSRLLKEPCRHAEVWRLAK